MLLACSISLITAIIIGAAASVRTESLVSEFAEGNVAHETRLIAQQFKGAYDELENDAFVISRTPPIEGIIRSRRNGGIDPNEDSTTRQWRSRLERIFTSIMVERPNYTQIRFIGLADGGRELTRVNRTQDGIAPVPLQDLQQKGQEQYFQRARTLARDEVYFSAVSFNREFGRIDDQLVPTIRVVVPVFSDGGSLYGMIVINADYRAMLTSYFQELRVDREIVVTNEAGDYMIRHADGTVSPFYFHTGKEHALGGLLIRPSDLYQDEWVTTNATSMAYSVRVPIKRSLDDAHNVVTVRVPFDELYATARKSLTEGLLLSGLLIIAILCITVYLATRMMKPLTDMTRTIQLAMHGGGKLSLARARTDEVGKLANAFQELIDSRNEHDARVNAVIDNVVDAIISLDDCGTVLAYNPASERIFGYGPEEVIGRNISLLMPLAIAEAEDDDQQSDRSAGERDEEGITRELQARRKDGTLFPMELSVSRVDLSDGSYMFTWIIRDITERKRMEVMQTEFVSTVNHELRTPLTSIRASLGILQRRLAGKLDDKSEHLVNISLLGCERLGRLVNDILDLEKIAAGKMDFYLDECNIGPLVRSIVDRHNSLAEINNIEFNLHIGFAEQYCRIDSSRFNQALVNLLSNAAKFSPPGKSVNIDLSMLGDGTVRIAVTDEGPGIPAAFREKIFQRFAQADSSATRTKGGSGLGLNITQSIIQAFNGTIHFESVEGEGATFIITLPVCAAPLEKAAPFEEGEPECQAA
ncbi:ATP-binding protein [Alteraurantiacibacter aestuarii]|uniref:ATP-binding protein n=1 Tax=Alteraurantiacibacter aestuarii TaxID=650004 RepID=UPI0031D313F7